MRRLQRSHYLVILLACIGPAVSQAEAIIGYAYAAGTRDASGATYFRARSYDAYSGRFMQRDPLGLAEGLNDYSYVAANPINAVDPLGLAAQPYGREELTPGQLSRFTSGTLFKLEDKLPYLSLAAIKIYAPMAHDLEVRVNVCPLCWQNLSRDDPASKFIAFSKAEFPAWVFTRNFAESSWARPDVAGLIGHELIHLGQMLEYGDLFSLRYQWAMGLFAWILPDQAYRNNRFEIEAYAAQSKITDLVETFNAEMKDVRLGKALHQLSEFPAAPESERRPSTR